MDVTPYTVDYTLSGGGNPTTADFAAATSTTCGYLREQLCTFFETNLELDFSGITCTAVSTGSSPVQISYEVTAVFASSSTTIPTQQEMDFAVGAAFTGSVVDDLVSNLRKLPTSNPFSTTSGVVSDLNPTLSQEKPTPAPIPSGLPFPAVIGMVVASSCVFVLLGLLAGRRFQQRNRHDQKIHPRDATDDTMEIEFLPQNKEEVSQLLFTESYECYSGCSDDHHQHHQRKHRVRPEYQPHIVNRDPDGAYLTDDDDWDWDR